MNISARIFELLQKNRLIALLTPKSVEDCLKAYEILNPPGIILEVAFRSEFASNGLKAVIDKYSDALVLAGTVLTRSQAEDAIKSGAAGSHL